MRSKRLRQVVTIEERSATPDSHGQLEDVWTTYKAGLRASIHPMQGRELYAAQQVNDETTHKIRMRYWPGISAKQRINWNGRIFNILSALDKDERNDEITLLCSEGLSDG